MTDPWAGRPSLTLTECRACGSRNLIPFLDLGTTPLANQLTATPDETVARFPLACCWCADCTLVALTEAVSPEIMYRHYVYLSGTSPSFREHSWSIADRLVERFSLDASSLVIEIASNDGMMLRRFRDRGTRVLGVDPARNIAQLANAEGIPTIPEFFDKTLAGRIGAEHERARLVLARNVIAHIHDALGALEGVATVLANDGVLAIEVPHLLELMRHVEFDTIYHEHLSYVSLRALTALCERAGLEVFDVEKTPVHGGSILVLAGPAGAHPRAPALGALLAEEDDAGLGREATFRTFADRVAGLRRGLVQRVEDWLASGRTLAAYGAPAKAVTLLSYTGLDRRHLAYTLDLNPLKQGRFLPGSGIPIVGPDRIRDDPADCHLLLAWNFADEICRQQAAYLARGGCFLVPVPAPAFQSNADREAPRESP